MLDSPSDDQNLVLRLWLTLDLQIPPSVLDVLRLCLNKDTAILLCDLELVERVESRGVLDVTRSDVEAS